MTNAFGRREVKRNPLGVYKEKKKRKKSPLSDGKR